MYFTTSSTPSGASRPMVGLTRSLHRIFPHNEITQNRRPGQKILNSESGNRSLAQTPSLTINVEHPNGPANNLDRNFFSQNPVGNLDKSTPAYTTSNFFPSVSQTTPNEIAGHMQIRRLEEQLKGKNKIIEELAVQLAKAKELNRKNSLP